MDEIFFHVFGAWSMFNMVNNLNIEHSLENLISSSFFALILSIVIIISDIIKDKKDMNESIIYLI